MTHKVNDVLKAQAKAKLRSVQQSASYHSFFDAVAIEAFSKVEHSAFAGTSIKRNTSDDSALHC